ncbi:MAG TPA: tripartite tricarboxylate transporter permease [Xanthobacteraceae bacterium]|nr:tripartite tricarboxylate transporter permease [Xanthobacteraceae bacterium]
MDTSLLHSVGVGFHTYLHDFTDGAALALHSAHTALFIVLDPVRMLYLFAGVCMGLALGILPGIGGIAGTALLLPFTYDLDPPTAFALLLGLGATTTTADPIAAILFGAPGHAASAATTLDGYPMTRRGEAGRALGASYMAALIGGLFGAALMAVALPVMRPIILYIGSPELLAIAVFGISMVAVLSGNAPLRGLTFACFGLMLRMIGTDPQSGTLRWTMGTLYLWDGLPLVPLTLGIFALPELCDLAIGRMAIVQQGQTLDTKTGMLLGIKDCIEHWFLILRCSWLGSAMGAIPGIGASVIDWISYGHALRTEKGAAQTFGTGDVRGVIAAESATNAREGGALVPTVAFGVPASAGMAILLGAFLIHGLVPGPDMLTKHLDLTYSMVWSIAIANILGSGLCFAFSGQLAKIAKLRFTLFMPAVLSLIYIGAFEATRSWGDLFSLLFFGVLGWAMKHFRWPRPPFVLGFILGEPIERYLFISIERYGVNWMIKPFVLIMFGLAAVSLLGPLVGDIRNQGGLRKMVAHWGRPQFSTDNLFPAALLILFVVMLSQSFDWAFAARIVPTIVGIGALLFCSLSLINDVFGQHKLGTAAAADAGGGKPQKIHMDIVSKTSHLPGVVVLIRGFAFFSWMVSFMAVMAVIGLIPTVPIFIVLFMRTEANEWMARSLATCFTFVVRSCGLGSTAQRLNEQSIAPYIRAQDRKRAMVPEPWKIVIPMATAVVLLIYVVFDQLLAIPWPPTLLGTLFPVLKAIPSV